MSAGLATFEIRLDRPDHTFSPGEIVTGQVLAELNRPKAIRCLKIIFKGAADVWWTESDGASIDLMKETTYRADEPYFREEVYTLGEPGNTEKVNIEAGSYVFPFKFTLPLNIPSSFKSVHGKVQYSVKAIMERPWKFDHKARAVFDVLNPYVLTEDMDLGPMVHDEKHETFAFFKTGGTVKFTVCIPSSGFEIGEHLQATVKIHNTSNADVTKVKLQLDQTTKYNVASPRSRTETINKKVAKCTESRTFARKDEVVLRLQVPTELPHSVLPHCSIIDIDYFATILISLSGLHCNVTRKYPIKIGIKPVAGVEYSGNPAASINAPTFEAPFLPPDESRTNLAPPSYNDAMRLDENEKL